ncbi:hypothetical protein LVD15_24000 [Fulvivirga maritima]|uniref:hypothetical protein n=1 Tax=Fulvivirga maritima TaxID=2904247 RepID=UPI001F4915D6|nr:hypothetical protein [Fulvivirga maritima]UII26323.1 hypothetical protein LVD15_24000 [Fulvivirga maritima]
MIDKDKIAEINAKRKSTKGFSEACIQQVGEKAVAAIAKNRSISHFNVKAIYQGFYLTSSVSDTDLIYNTSADTKTIIE